MEKTISNYLSRKEAGQLLYGLNEEVDFRMVYFEMKRQPDSPLKFRIVAKFNPAKVDENEIINFARGYLKSIRDSKEVAYIKLLENS